MLMKSCSKCGALIPYGKARCSNCEAEREAEQQEQAARNNKRYNQRRKTKADPKYKAFYKSKAWRDMSLRMMADAMYRCEVCGGIATEVHHIVPIQCQAGWERRFDESNLKVVCVRCHNKEHERF